jgi:hypothetical protein
MCRATRNGDDLLQQGIERSTIALWLGHESVETTQIYLDADSAIKQAALDRTTTPATREEEVLGPQAGLVDPRLNDLTRRADTEIEHG